MTRNDVCSLSAAWRADLVVFLSCSQQGHDIFSVLRRKRFEPTDSDRYIAIIVISLYLLRRSSFIATVSKGKLYIKFLSD